MKPQLILLCPTPRDLHHLGSENIRERYEILPFGDYQDNPASFDVSNFIKKADAFIEQTSGLQGILGPGDYPESILASLLIQKFSLPGPSPESVFLCQHKYYSRREQKNSVPHAVPQFFVAPLDRTWKEEEIPLPFPFFVKPVKGVLSLFSRPVHFFEEFSRTIQESREKLPPWVRPFNHLLEASHLAEKFPLKGDCLIAEEILSGHQVTLEGYVYQGEVFLIEIVDSIFYPGTRSFERFQCPSSLPPPIQERMVEVCRRFLKQIRFNNGIFNIEFIYHPQRKTYHILEVNSRLAHQFAGMMEAIHGTNTYEIMIDLALGRKPSFCRFAGEDRAAASFVLRAFEDGWIDSVPSPEDLKKIDQAFPKVQVEILVSPGRNLSDHFRQDEQSYRYAIINLSGKSEGDLLAQGEEVKRLLPFRFSKKK